MGNSRIVYILGYTGGVFLVLLGVTLVLSGVFATGRLDTVLGRSVQGLHTTEDALRLAAAGVDGSSGMIEDVKFSLETTSEVVSVIGAVIAQTVAVLEELRVTLTVASQDVASLPDVLRNLMVNNHFDEIAERMQVISTELGYLNTQLEDLSGSIAVVGNAIGEVAVSVDSLEGNLNSAQNSVNGAAEKIEQAAVMLDNGRYSNIITFGLVCVGFLILIIGIYQILSAKVLKSLMKGL